MNKYEISALSTAKIWADLSTAPDKRVGACLLIGKRIRSTGYNGVLPDDPHVFQDDKGVTLPTVIHAERNVLNDCSRHGLRTEGATLAVTLSPCVACASDIVSAGIKRVIYLHEYKCGKGLSLLQQHNVSIEKGYLL